MSKSIFSLTALGRVNHEVLNRTLNLAIPRFDVELIKRKIRNAASAVVEYVKAHPYQVAWIILNIILMPIFGNLLATGLLRLLGFRALGPGAGEIVHFLSGLHLC